MGVSTTGGTPESFIYRWIFPNKNHPCGGYLHVCGNPPKKTSSLFCGELRLLKSLRTHPFLFHLGFHFYATPLGAESVGDTGIVLLCFCWKWKVSHIVFHHIPGPHEKRPWSCRSRRWNLRTATRKVVAHQPMELHISHTRPADPTTCAGREVGSKRWTKTRQFRWE